MKRLLITSTLAFMTGVLPVYAQLAPDSAEQNLTVDIEDNISPGAMSHAGSPPPQNPAQSSAQTGPQIMLDADAVLPLVRDYIVSNPEVLQSLVLEYQERETHKRQLTDSALIKDHEEALTDTANAVIMGNPEGAFTVVVFQDFACGACNQQLADLEKLASEQDDIRVILRQLPFTTDNSIQLGGFVQAVFDLYGAETHQKVARGILSAKEVNADTLMGIINLLELDGAKIDERMRSEEMKAIFDANVDLAKKLEITSLPAFVFHDIIGRSGVGYDVLNGAYHELTGKPLPAAADAPAEAAPDSATSVEPAVTGSGAENIVLEPSDAVGIVVEEEEREKD